jgi:hypothetical protein
MAGPMDRVLIVSFKTPVNDVTPNIIYIYEINQTLLRGRVSENLTKEEDQNILLTPRITAQRLTRPVHRNLFRRAQLRISVEARHQS